MLRWLSASLLALAACGGDVEPTFLEHCQGSCSAGLECIKNTCTRACANPGKSCSDLAPQAACGATSDDPVEVPMCDVTCASATDCSELGDDYACEYGFCRRVPGNRAGQDCRAVGRYAVGKEGGYLPCCPGLTQISTRLEATNGDGELVCAEFPVNSYACLAGSCGDGICEPAEASCACGVDCPDSVWRADEMECATFRDASPSPPEPMITIVNTGATALYLLPLFVDCITPPSLIQVLRSGQALNVMGGGDCDIGCDRVLSEGGPYTGPGDPTPECPSIDCRAPRPVRLAPGESLAEPAGLEVIQQQLPRACAANIATDTTPCVSRVVPQAGSSYSLQVRALLDLSSCEASGACVCSRDGTCSIDATPLLFALDTTSYFANQTIQIAAPID
jgi:hypothetical protein